MQSNGTPSTFAANEKENAGLSRRALVRQVGTTAAAVVLGASIDGKRHATAAPSDHPNRISRTSHQTPENEVRKPLNQYDYNGRTIEYGAEAAYGNNLVLRIDGVACDLIIQDNNLYHSRFLPHVGFPTVEGMAEVLVDAEGAQWKLTTQGLPATPIAMR